MFYTRDKEVELKERLGDLENFVDKLKSREVELKERLGDLENVVDKLKSRIVTLERDNSLKVYHNDVAKSIGCPYEEVSMKSVVYGLLHHLGLQMKVSPAKDKEVRLLQSDVSNKGE